LRVEREYREREIEKESREREREKESIGKNAPQQV
jgi:hypothetical protein